MENGTTGAETPGAQTTNAASGWAGAVAPALVARLQRPARRPGLVRLGYARTLLARHRAMVPGVPLADALLQRVPEPRSARDEPPVVAAQPVPVPVEARQPDPVPAGPVGPAGGPAPVPVVRAAAGSGAGAGG